MYLIKPLYTDIKNKRNVSSLFVILIFKFMHKSLHNKIQQVTVEIRISE